MGHRFMKGTIMSTITFPKLARRIVSIAALGALVLAMGGTWMTSRPALASPPTPGTPVPATGPVVKPAVVATVPTHDLDEEHAPKKSSSKKELAGKLNLNAATA